MNQPLADGDIGPLDAEREHRGGRAILVDVREQDEWDAGHAPGAIHLPLAALDAGQLAGRGRIVAVCRSGNRSRRAAALLTAAGIDVVNLAGGMTEWLRCGLPVVTDSGRPGDVT
ncbi:MAG TPA: rhodanese-like domain-containing protein [Jatrophihabitans sp.]|nr:rhodanese-like domain-containing protein [Jatrophihabitans sp.]